MIAAWRSVAEPQSVRLFIDMLDTPLGRAVILADGARLRALDFHEREQAMLAPLRRRYGDLELVPAVDPLGITSRLRAYFAGELDAIEGIPVEAEGTAFQQRVWAALRTIPAGRTLSYGELAAKIGAPTACRAVGLANGRNPIGIVVPCHRVIGADGTLTGYGGGLERKRWLLEHEGVRLPFADRLGT
jgi:methylated-DNA-[protein]-cysteine S-methyltransferase